jgi:hypothetical protein
MLRADALRFSTLRADALRFSTLRSLRSLAFRASGGGRLFDRAATASVGQRPFEKRSAKRGASKSPERSDGRRKAERASAKRRPSPSVALLTLEEKAGGRVGAAP